MNIFTPNTTIRRIVIPPQAQVQIQQVLKQTTTATKKQRLNHLKRVMSLLHMSRERIRTGWCQDAPAKSRAGNVVVPTSKRAVCWDIPGSLQATTMPVEVQRSAFEYLIKAWDYKNSRNIVTQQKYVPSKFAVMFIDWSTHYDRSLNNILELFHNAIVLVIDDTKRIY